MQGQTWRNGTMRRGHRAGKMGLETTHGLPCPGWRGLPRGKWLRGVALSRLGLGAQVVGAGRPLASG